MYFPPETPRKNPDRSAKRPSPTTVAADSPEPKNAKLNATETNDIAKHIASLSKYKDDFTVEYYFVPLAAAGDVRNQADRDYIAQAMCYFSPRSKRDRTLSPATVTNNLANDVQGVTTDRSAANGVSVVFKAAKHIAGAVSYIQATAVDHNNVKIRMRIDASNYFDV